MKRESNIINRSEIYINKIIGLILEKRHDINKDRCNGMFKMERVVDRVSDWF